MSDTTTPPAAPPVPEPQAGGSYVRDPVTGELQRVQFTRPAEDSQQAEEPQQ